MVATIEGKKEGARGEDRLKSSLTRAYNISLRRRRKRRRRSRRRSRREMGEKAVNFPREINDLFNSVMEKPCDVKTKPAKPPSRRTGETPNCFLFKF